MVEATANGDNAGTIVPVGEAKSSLPTPDLGGLRLVDTQTKVIGVIYPPPDIRAIVDKTAGFVARNGAEFEKRILANEQNNVKFNFLRSTDPYHAYYQFKLKEFREGDKAEGKDEAAAFSATPAAAAAVPAVVPIAAPAVPPKQLEPPAKEEYTVPVPPGLTSLDLDIYKLTAQFVARNGKTFLTGLAQREYANPQFNFLKPTHSMFTFFTALSDAYSKVLMPPKHVREKLEKDITDRAAILERCLKRLEWDKAQEEAAAAAASEAEKERMAMQNIDWHDFVVVETIEFFEEEDDELPLPMTLRDVIAINKAVPFGEEEEAEAAEAQEEEMEVEMDEEERAMVVEGEAAAAEAAAPPPIPPPPVVNGTAKVEAIEDTEDQPIRIVKNYKRPEAGRADAHDPTKLVVSPITGELVPIDQMEEHMRVSLIDPKWREQRDAMMAKIRETTRADDDEIGRNLVVLAKTRPDIFGSTQEEVSQIVKQSMRDAMISGNDRPVVWDGQTTSGEELNAQLKAIRSSKQTHRSNEPAASQRPQQGPSMGPPPVRPTGQLVRPPPSLASQQQLPPPMRPPPPQAPRAMPPPAPGPSRGPMPPPAAAPPRPMAPPPMRPAPAMAPPPGANILPPPPRPPPGGPILPRDEPPPVPEDEPDAKRQRTDFVLQPEEDFLGAHPGATKVQIMCPDMEENEKLSGQLLMVEVPSLAETVGDLKTRLVDVTGIPSNRQKLSRDGVGFMKDEYSLAWYNVGPDTQLTFGLKERGGRKK